MAEEKGREYEVKLKNVRLSFAHVFRAQESKPDPVTGKKGPPKFNCNFLMSKTDEDGKVNARELSRVMNAAGDAKWGSNPPAADIKSGKAKAKWSLKPEKKCLRDGDLETYDGYADHYYLSASNTRKPKILGRRKEEITEESGRIYSGCYVNAIVRIWVQDNEHGKRINASLEGIQFVRDGEAFGAAPLDDDAFDALDDEADGLSDDTDNGEADDIL